jgi:hypothetical protein
MNDFSKKEIELSEFGKIKEISKMDPDMVDRMYSDSGCRLDLASASLFDGVITVDNSSGKFTFINNESSGKTMMSGKELPLNYGDISDIIKSFGIPDGSFILDIRNVKRAKKGGGEEIIYHKTILIKRGEEFIVADSGKDIYGDIFFTDELRNNKGIFVDCVQQNALGSGCFLNCVFNASALQGVEGGIKNKNIEKIKGVFSSTDYPKLYALAVKHCEKKIDFKDKENALKTVKEEAKKDLEESYKSCKGSGWVL